MKKTTILALAITATACGQVQYKPANGADDSDDVGTDGGAGTGSDHGSDSDQGSGSGQGSDVGSGSGSGSDTQQPGALSFYGSIKDERGDSIDFSTNQPVHTHAGAEVKLTGDNCPAIYKYAYLTDTTAPRFGHEASANPLAFKVDAKTGYAASASYRVRSETNTLLDWTSMPSSNGTYTAMLHRNSVPEIGTTVAKMYVDARFHDDTSNTDKVITQCFENHPLAAPLQINAIAPSTLFGLSLPDQSLFAPLLNAGPGIDVASLAVIQTTAEPIDVTFTGNSPTGTATRTVIEEFISGTPRTLPTPVACPSTDGSACLPSDTTPALVDTTGPTSGTWSIRVVDDVTGNTSCVAQSTMTSRCVIPARTTAEGPHGYHVVISDSNEQSLAPATNSTDFSFDGQTLNGVQLAAIVSCTNHVIMLPPNGQRFLECTERTPFQHIKFLHKAKIAFDPIVLTMKSNVGDATIAVPATALSLAAQTWDAGTKAIDM